MEKKIKNFFKEKYGIEKFDPYNKAEHEKILYNEILKRRTFENIAIQDNKKFTEAEIRTTITKGFPIFYRCKVYSKELHTDDQYHSDNPIIDCMLDYLSKVGVKDK